MQTIKGIIKDNGDFQLITSGSIFNVTDVEYQKIISGLYNVSFEDDAFVFEDNIEAQEIDNEKQIAILKAEKAKAIEEIASLSDQLNLTAGTLDIIVDVLAQTNPEILEHPWIIESKNKLEAIKLILND